MCVRSSIPFYGHFNLGMDRSPGFGSAIHNSTRCSHSVSLRLRTFLVLNLAMLCNSPDRSTKSTRSRLISPGVCKQRVSGSFSLPSRGSFHLSFTVLSTIGRQVVFRLGGWSPRLPAGFLVPRGTLDTASPSSFSSTGLSPSLACFPKTLRLTPMVHVAVRNPSPQAGWFGLFPFRSPLLWKSRLISLPVATKMFQFATFPSHTLWIYV